MVRCFIGIFLPENVKNEVVTIQNELKKVPMICKFVEFENLHISISFLGEIPNQEIKAIEGKLAGIAKLLEKFDVDFHGLKLIPNERYVRVIALDVFDKNKMLIALGKMVRDSIGGDVKPPHLTLCRVRNITNKTTFLENIRSLQTKVSSFTAYNVCLIKSELGRHGPTYSMLSEASFG